MREILFIAAAVVCLSMLSVPSNAGDRSASNHYTGCLSTKGYLTKLEPGDYPRRRCRDYSKQITLKGEDPKGGTETIPFFLELDALPRPVELELLVENGPLELLIQCETEIVHNWTEAVTPYARTTRCLRKGQAFPTDSTRESMGENTCM